MSFMESARGHILRFLWKQRQGAFLDMSLDDIKAKLVSRGSVIEGDFDAALQTLVDDGHVTNGKMTGTGADTMATEYKQHLSSLVGAAPLGKKAEMQAISTDFDEKYAQDVAVRVDVPLDISP
jgi:hypothetical protein